MSEDYTDKEWQAILDAWPDCPVKGCLNKCCKALNSKYCWPHTRSDTYVEDIIDVEKVQDRS